MVIEKTLYWINGDSGVMSFPVEIAVSDSDDFILRISKYRRVVYEFRASENQISLDGETANVFVPDNTLLQIDNGVFEYKFLSVKSEAEHVRQLGFFYIRNHSDEEAASPAPQNGSGSFNQIALPHNGGCTGDDIGKLCMKTETQVTPTQLYEPYLKLPGRWGYEMIFSQQPRSRLDTVQINGHPLDGDTLYVSVVNKIFTWRDNADSSDRQAVQIGDSALECCENLRLQLKYFAGNTSAIIGPVFGTGQFEVDYCPAASDSFILHQEQFYWLYNGSPVVDSGVITIDTINAYETPLLLNPSINIVDDNNLTGVTYSLGISQFLPNMGFQGPVKWGMVIPETPEQYCFNLNYLFKANTGSYQYAHAEVSGEHSIKILFLQERSCDSTSWFYDIGAVQVDEFFGGQWHLYFSPNDKFPALLNGKLLGKIIAVTNTHVVVDVSEYIVMSYTGATGLPDSLSGIKDVYFPSGNGSLVPLAEYGNMVELLVKQVFNFQFIYLLIQGDYYEFISVTGEGKAYYRKTRRLVAFQNLIINGS